MASEKKDTLFDRLRKLLGKPDTPQPTPTPDTTPDAPQPSYLKVLLALRGIPVQQLGPLLFTVPVIVFLAISGVVAWLAIGLGVVVRLLRVVSGL
jgi:hypothetical protein